MDRNRNTKLKIALLSVYFVTASLNAITANIPEMAKTFSTVPVSDDRRALRRVGRQTDRP